MARITNARLRVGRVSSATEFAEMTVTVRWTSREVSENLAYTLSAYVIERDDGRDFFDMLPDGNLQWKSIGNLDDFVGTIRRMTVRPNGSSSRSYTMRRDWDFGNQEGGAEEYNGVATIVPEIRSDVRFAPEISANLG